MAKQIKIIKCPNCSSIEKTEVKPDYYRCENCNTEYFLDSDDININIKHHGTKESSPFRHPMLKLIGASLITTIIVTFITILLKDKPSTPPSIETIRNVQNNLPSNTTTPQNSENVIKAASYSKKNIYCSMENVADKLYVISLQSRKDNLSANQYYFVAHELLENKQIQEQKITDIISNKSNLAEWNIEDFSTDKTYFISNKNSIYLLDKKNYTLTNVTHSLLKNHAQYQAGIASINISRTTYGNALHILTNDGKKLYYYPLSDRVYIDNSEFYMGANRQEAKPIDTSEQLMYSFAHYYQEDYKLIKYTFISPDGKNHLEPRSSKVGKAKLDSDGYHEDADSAYDMLNNSNLDITILSHQNLTPGRLYFSPSILYFDKNYLIIKTKVSAAPGAGYNYQQLNVNTGEVIWTLSDSVIKINEIVPYQDKLIVKNDCDNYAIINKSGRIEKIIKLSQ